MSEQRYGFKVTQVSARTWSLDVYAIHDDCGPYCLSWQRIKKADIPSVTAEARAREWIDMEADG